MPSRKVPLLLAWTGLCRNSPCVATLRIHMYAAPMSQCAWRLQRKEEEEQEEEFQPDEVRERTAIIVGRMVWQASQHVYVEELGPVDLIFGLRSLLQRSTVENREVGSVATGGGRRDRCCRLIDRPHVVVDSLLSGPEWALGPSRVVCRPSDCRTV